MKIAIVNKPGSFSDRWLEYCKKNNIPYKEVNPYASDIVEQVRDCDAFMWHFHHHNYKDCLIAKQLTFALQQSGKIVFPDFNTSWHFDDKIGEKYLFETIDAPFVKSYVFYTKQEALKWIEQTTFPKVFKLRGGAGAMNVKLAKTKAQAKSFIAKSFRKGYSQYDRWGHIFESIQKFHQGQGNFMMIIKNIARLFKKPNYAKMLSNEKGYVYFQDFIPNNDHDLRIVVIGNKAFAIRRNCRRGDFRASGSGNIIYLKNTIDERCVRIAFDLNKKLNSQCIGYDFIFDNANNPLIVECSFGFSAKGYDNCEGYWTDDMVWHSGSNFDFCGWMVENIIKK